MTPNARARARRLPLEPIPPLAVVRRPRRSPKRSEPIGAFDYALDRLPLHPSLQAMCDDFLRELFAGDWARTNAWGWLWQGEEATALTPDIAADAKRAVERMLSQEYGRWVVLYLLDVIDAVDLAKVTGLPVGESRRYAEALAADARTRLTEDGGARRRINPWLGTPVQAQWA